MSTIEVNTIDSVSGTSTLTLGSSNAGTIALGSGDVQVILTPCFLGYLKMVCQTIQVIQPTKLTF